MYILLKPVIMNTVKKLCASISVMALALTVFAQGNDTGFVARNIRNHIISIKMAQMALDRSDQPRIKTLAREIIGTDRETLRRLLANADASEVQGPSDKQLDSIVNNFRTDSLLSPLDTEGAATSGNNITDSLGSGSSGSGNVSGQDTGTIARSHSNQENPNYSEQGDYLYRNQPAIEALKGIDKKKGRQFNQSWLRFMLSSSDAKLRDFENESNNSKDDKLRMAVVQTIPKIRSQKDMIAKVAGRDAAPARRDDPGVSGPSNKNTPRQNQ
jgi:predicted outer membrane protein